MRSTTDNLTTPDATSKVIVKAKGRRTKFRSLDRGPAAHRYHAPRLTWLSLRIREDINYPKGHGYASASVRNAPGISAPDTANALAIT